jgi:hypothetical protein
MIDNPIVEEVHKSREALLKKYGGDLEALMTDAQRRTEEAAKAGRKVIALAPRSPLLVEANAKKAS